MLSQGAPDICFNEHISCDGEIIFQRACELGLEGIVSKRKGVPLMLHKKFRTMVLFGNFARPLNTSASSSAWCIQLCCGLSRDKPPL
jgi:hypothetical protein